MKFLTIPSYISLLRILLIVPVCGLINSTESEPNFLAAALFLIASLTDFIDGYLARKYNLETRLGSFLDLLADKFLICSVLIYVCVEINNSYFTLPSVLIIFRELAITALREYVSNSPSRSSLKVSFFGKLKTTIQMIVLTLVILLLNFEAYKYLLQILIWLACFISIVSLLQYIKEVFRSSNFSKFN